MILYLILVFAFFFYFFDHLSKIKKHCFYWRFYLKICFCYFEQKRFYISKYSYIRKNQIVWNVKKVSCMYKKEFLQKILILNYLLSRLTTQFTSRHKQTIKIQLMPASQECRPVKIKFLQEAGFILLWLF